MTDSTLRPPSFLAPVGRTWMRISPRLAPALAIITALVLTVVFMVFTGGRGDIGRGLGIAGSAYSALLEGSIGVAINDVVSRDDFGALTAFSSGDPLTRSELRTLGRDLNDLNEFGIENVDVYAPILTPFTDLDDDAIDALTGGVIEMRGIGAERLTLFAPLILELNELERAQVRELAETYATRESLTEEDQGAIIAIAPTAVNYDAGALLEAMQMVNTFGIVRLVRALDVITTLEIAGIAPESPEADRLAELGAITSSSGDPNGASSARDAKIILDRLVAAGASDVPALIEQISVVRAMYDAGLLTADEVGTALNTELEPALASNLVVRRPGNRLVVAAGTQPAGTIYADTTNTPDDTSDDEADIVYLRLGGSTFLFFPAQLEGTIVRAIPFIIAGLAVALGFKAGVFNIGAEGQVYMGSLLAVWVGFAPAFAGLPMLLHVALVLICGMLGGALWGAIPGVLKAYTGAHEVIVTIMLNYIAIRFVDWIIKSTEPIILLDPTASTPRTPFIHESAIMPRMDAIPAWAFILAGVIVAGIGIYRIMRSSPSSESGGVRFALFIRPIIWGIVTAVGGLFLAWVTVLEALHIGFIIMLAAVWFTDWFLNRTTPGFELRTVGTNPNAAKYAGMNVRRNTILALALSGLLAGLAGSIEISAVQYTMKPEFFAGLGFDAIAVALLARTEPKSMIWAGFLWGALLSGAGLMQVRADISIDLVRIIQALIIMFIAADAIIRYLWRIPKTEQSATFAAKGWSS